MRFYPLLDFQYVMAAIVLALGALAAILLFFKAYSKADRQEPEERELEEYTQGLRAAHNRIPLIIVLLIAALVVWVFNYVLHIGIRGPAF